MEQKNTAAMDAQRKACRYILSICDVCADCRKIRSPGMRLEGTECVSGEKECRGPAPERQGGEAPGWRTSCPHFKADRAKLHELLRCRQQLHEEEYRAISALRAQLPQGRWG